MPDYTFANAPDDFAALVLIGGTDWFGPDAAAVLPLVHNAVQCGAVLGAICDASVFLGVHGFLNNVRHTSNNPAFLKEKAGDAYTGEALYQAGAPSVRDGKVVTANGAGFIDFAVNVLEALDAAPKEKLIAFSTFCKTGMFQHDPMWTQRSSPFNHGLLRFAPIHSSGNGHHTCHKGSPYLISSSGSLGTDYRLGI